MSKILICEDNIQLAEVLETFLCQHYAVDVVHNGEDAIQLLNSFSYDLLILDWELPDIDGLQVCEHYRKDGGISPILFLTGRSDTRSKATGLDAGADDYLTKPFDFEELTARLRSLLRRSAGFATNVLQVPGLSLELESRTAIVADNRVLLTPREFGILEFLVRHPNRTYTSKSLLDSVWPADSAFSEDTVRSCMRSLRKKISTESGECVIKTIQGSGYIIEK